MSTYVQAHLKHACMRTREYVYVSASVVAKNDRLSSVCVYSRLNPALHWDVFEHMCTCTNVAVFHSVYVCVPSVHLSASLYACLCESMYVQPSALLSTLLYASMNVYFSV